MLLNSFRQSFIKIILPRLTITSTSNWNFQQSRCYSEKRNQSKIRIGCASGFWGDTPTASRQLIEKVINRLIDKLIKQCSLFLSTGKRRLLDFWLLVWTYYVFINCRHAEKSWKGWICHRFSTAWNWRGIIKSNQR